MDDTRFIRDFIARDSPRYAALVAQQLVGAVERLETLPRSGRVVPEFRDDRLREIISGSYRIVYQLLDDTVEVLTVHHGARIFIDPRGE
ncbi:MAG: plasmid stabilization protein [SAR202 cluster bacterium Io17-Chloro-G2]|nr:MAG: plasmid stabilization protein [SAR202 cluster bacterium Io17-Chloro-G2]